LLVVYIVVIMMHGLKKVKYLPFSTLGMVRYATTLIASRLRCNLRLRLCINRDAISESVWDHSCAADVFFQCDVFL